ncbi:WW domain binding protein VOPP1 isoform X2 [Symphalangus syndactylus]|uniref:WW domain binding protein VOPP1 isoform X2 n=1 Tax=Symphalangus syndactylus TaxID=9590 RepID=UPI0024427344|nr:vesicular, overexpressed in cancer, prosurvival protein 1 isoform X1 [Symphalangus syndactylus]
MRRQPAKVAALLLWLLLEMPLLRGLLWLQVLCAGPLYTEAVVLLVPSDDGRALLLRSRLLHPEAHVPPAADRGASLQCVLHQATPKSWPRSPAAGAALLHRPRRTRDEPCREFHGNGFPGPTQLTPGECGLPSPSSLLQHASAPVRTGSEGQVAGCPRARGETGEGLSLAFLSPLMFTSRNGLMGH